MAIRLAQYQSQAPSAQFRGGNRAATQSATLNVKNDADYILGQVALGAAKQASDTGFKQAVQLHEQQQAADILDEADRYYQATQVFETEYEIANPGKKARNAPEVFTNFHKKQQNERSLRFVDDPKMSVLWQRQASQIQRSSTGRGFRFSLQQDAVYKKQVTAQQTEQFFNKVAQAPNDQVVDNLRTQFNAQIAAINSPEATEVIMSKADQQVAETRINTAIANSDTQEAKRLLSEYKEAGVLGNITDEMTKKVKTATIEDKAYNISLEVMDTMPGATKTQKLDKTRELAGDDKEIYKQARYQVLQDHSTAEAAKNEQEALITDMFETQIFEAKTHEQRQQVSVNIMNTPMSSSLRTKLLTKNNQGLKQPMVSDENHLAKVREQIAMGTMTEDQLKRERWYLSKDDYTEQSQRFKEEGGNRVSAFEIYMGQKLTNAFSSDAKDTRTEKVKVFTKAMDQFVKEFRTQNKRFPSSKEMEAQYEFQMQEVIYDENWWWGGDKTVERFYLDSVDVKDFDVPSDFQRAANLQRTNANLPPLTAADMTTTYKQYIQGKR